MTGGATGRPAGAIRQPLGEMARRAGDILSPAGRSIAGGFGGGTTAVLTPDGGAGRDQAAA
jgi:hypothetical protein